MKFIDKLYLPIVVLLLVGLYFGFSNFLICILAIIFRLISCNKHTAGFFLLIFGGPIGGVIRSVYPALPVYGLLLQLLGFLLLIDQYKDVLKNGKSFRYLILVFFVFFVSFLFAQHTEYANSKIFDIIKHGTLAFYGYYVFCTSNKIKSEHICQLLLLMSISFICYLVQKYGAVVGNFNDYNSFRNSLEGYAYLNKESSLIGYQNISMAALFGLAILLSFSDFNKTKLIAYVIIGTQLVLVGGARQAILGLLVVIILRFLMTSKTGHAKKIISLLVGVVVVYLGMSFISSMNIQAINSAIETGGSGRDLIFLDCLRIISEHPIFGVGLGGYPLYSMTDSPWPHNMILEIICETGFLGCAFLFTIVVAYLRGNKINFRYHTQTNVYLFLILSALFVRVMFSSDLAESIEFFSGLFAAAAVVNNRIEK